MTICLCHGGVCESCIRCSWPPLEISQPVQALLASNPAASPHMQQRHGRYWALVSHPMQETFISICLLSNICNGSLCCPCTTQGIALVLHCFRSIICMCSAIFSLQRRQCMECSVAFFRPQIFSPGDDVWYHSHTPSAHVFGIVVGPSTNGPQFCHIRYMRLGGVTEVDHENAHFSRLEAVVVALPKSPESLGVSMASEPQTQIQPTVLANVSQKPRGAACSNSKPPLPPPPLHTPPKFWNPSFSNLRFRGKGSKIFLPLPEGVFFFYVPMCLYSKYSEFCGEVKNV